MTIFILFVLLIIIGVYAYETRQQVQRLAAHIDQVNTLIGDYLTKIEDRVVTLENKRKG